MGSPLLPYPMFEPPNRLVNYRRSTRTPVIAARSDRERFVTDVGVFGSYGHVSPDNKQAALDQLGGPLDDGDSE
jgi:hypothetical protein